MLHNLFNDALSIYMYIILYIIIIIFGQCKYEVCLIDVFFLKCIVIHYSVQSIYSRGPFLVPYLFLH